MFINRKVRKLASMADILSDAEDELRVQMPDGEVARFFGANRNARYKLAISVLNGWGDRG